jgi:hypothetical protein
MLDKMSQQQQQQSQQQQSQQQPSFWDPPPFDIVFVFVKIRQQLVSFLFFDELPDTTTKEVCQQMQQWQHEMLKISFWQQQLKHGFPSSFLSGTTQKQQTRHKLGNGSWSLVAWTFSAWTFSGWTCFASTEILLRSISSNPWTSTTVHLIWGLDILLF